MVNTTAASTARQILQRLGEEQQHDQHHGGEGDLRQLPPSAGALGHGGLARAAVHHEGAAQGRGGIRGGEAQDVVVDLDPLAVAAGEHARGGGALRHDDDEAGRRDRQQRQALGPGHIRKGEGRQPTRHRADGGDAVGGETVAPARPDRGHDHEHRDRHARGEAAADQDDADHGRSQRQCRQVRVLEPNQDLPGLHHGPARLHRDAEHVGQHADADLDADAGEEAHQHGPRQEIRKEPQPEQARHQQQRRGQQGHHADQRQILRARRVGHGGQRAGQDRGRAGIGGHDQMARRGEDREGERRQQGRVEPGHHRHLGDARVAQHLRDIHGGERHAGDRVPPGCGPAPRADAAEQSHAHPCSVRCRPLVLMLEPRSPFIQLS